MAYTGPDLCLTDYGMVEVTSSIRREAWALGVPIWQVCTRRAWEALERSPCCVNRTLEDDQFYDFCGVRLMQAADLGLSG
jgi:hypothetical protein